MVLLLTSIIVGWRLHKYVDDIYTYRDTISEGIDGKQSDLFEEMGVDSDEVAGVSLAELTALLPANKGIKRRR
jgi:hypothetical protein